MVGNILLTLVGFILFIVGIYNVLSPLCKTTYKPIVHLSIGILATILGCMLFLTGAISLVKIFVYISLVSQVTI